jgi:hypothetical protein
MRIIWRLFCRAGFHCFAYLPYEDVFKCVDCPEVRSPIKHRRAT